MLNKAILMGRLTRDPEHRYVNDRLVCQFTLAIDRSAKDANGEKITDFINCTAWGKRADFMKQYFSKGMMAIVCGRIQSRNWEDKNGNKRTTIEINADEISFGETKKAREAGGAMSASNYKAPYVMPDSNDFAELGDDDGDVPF